MSVMRPESLGAEGLPRGHGRWEHKYGIALGGVAQGLSRLNFTQTKRLLHSQAHDCAVRCCAAGTGHSDQVCSSRSAVASTPAASAAAATAW